MLSKEEYKRNLIRMLDGLRVDEYKGATNCVGIACEDCPLYKKACGPFYVFEALEFVEKWAEEHIKTNADKFKEMFGVEAPINCCMINNETLRCQTCEYYDYESDSCKTTEKFWEIEYKPRKEVEE